MDRIGLAGAQGTGKTTLARRLADLYGYRYLDAGVGNLMSKLGVVVGQSMPLVERLQVQLQVAKHIAELTKGSGSFVMDRTPVDVMAYTIDLFGMTNEDEAHELFSEIQKVCMSAAVQNYNAMFGLRPGIVLSDEDKQRAQRASLDPLYVRRIDSLVFAEFQNVNRFIDKTNLTLGFLPATVVDLEARVELIRQNIERVTLGHVRANGITLH